MASTTDVAKQYFAALSAHDLDAAVEVWAPGGIGRVVAQHELVAPDGIRDYFAGLFEAFPDFAFEVLETTMYKNRCAVRWRARGTFAGPGRFEGFRPNGAALELEGCDVITVADQRIVRNEAYFDSAAVARQLGFLPAAGSAAEARLTWLANAATRLRALGSGAEAEAIAPGVWLVRGGRPRYMNVYLIEDEGGLTVFDAGISAMTTALLVCAARLGGIRRVVLGHADADHRGAAPGLGAPVFCHPADRAAAQSPSSFRDYWDLTKLAAWARPLYPRLLASWDGGPVAIEGTVAEGEQIAGFRVVHLPGHAPGQIGLFRDQDRLALVSDCVYTVNAQTGVRGGPSLPHPAFNEDTERARASVRKLAQLDPAVVWTGHAGAVTGDVAAALDRAAAAPA
jgi:steroid delta-isomerase-like uncharacterized protein